MAADDQRLRTLSEVMADEGLLSLSRTTELVEQIAAALETARRRGLVVARLEPHSIFVAADADDPVHHPFDNPFDSPIDGSRTRILPFASTYEPHSESPFESASAEGPAMTPLPLAHDPAHQVALASIAYEMLAGCSPFTDDPTQVSLGLDLFEPSAYAAAQAQLPTASAPPLSEMVMGVPHALDEIFQRALSSDADQRFPSVGDFVAALRRVDADANQGDIDAANEATIEAAIDAAIAAAQVTGNQGQHRTPYAAYVSAAPASGSAMANAGSATETSFWSSALAAKLPRKSPAPGLAALPASNKPSLRTQVSFLAAAVLIVVSAIGVMSGSRKKVVAAEPGADTTLTTPITAPVPVMMPRPRAPAPLSHSSSLPASVPASVPPTPPPSAPTSSLPTPSMPTPSASPTSATSASRESSSKAEKTTHRRSRRHLAHRPRIARR